MTEEKIKKPYYGVEENCDNGDRCINFKQLEKKHGGEKGDCCNLDVNCFVEKKKMMK